jgi:hypothetical protein
MSDKILFYSLIIFLSTDYISDWSNAIYDSLDDLHNDIKEIGRKIDRKNLSEE